MMVAGSASRCRLFGEQAAKPATRLCRFLLFPINRRAGALREYQQAGFGLPTAQGGPGSARGAEHTICTTRGGQKRVWALPRGKSNKGEQQQRETVQSAEQVSLGGLGDFSPDPTIKKPPFTGLLFSMYKHRVYRLAGTTYLISFQFTRTRLRSQLLNVEKKILSESG